MLRPTFERTRRASAGTVLILLMALSGVTAARAAVVDSPLSRLATGVTGLASDQERFAIWTTSSNGVVAFDAATGRRRPVTIPGTACAPPRIVAVHDATALVECYPDPSFVVDLRSGRAFTLGDPWRPDFTVRGIGSRWIRGWAPCPDRPGDCDALLDRRSNAITYQPRSGAVLDLDARVPTVVTRCRSRFTTPTYDGRAYVDLGSRGSLHLGRCGGRGQTLWPSPYSAHGATVGGGFASWSAGGSAYAHSLAGRRRLRWQVGGSVVAAAHTRTRIMIARAIDQDRAGSYTATLLTARLPREHVASRGGA